MAVKIFGAVLDILNIQVVQCNPTSEQHVDYNSICLCTIYNTTYTLT